MTALEEYQRLEAVGLWRADSNDDGKEVVVKFGKATLVIEASADAPLAHWSLPALHERSRTSERTIYSPDDESAETLTIEDAEMQSALSRVLAGRRAAQSSRTKNGPGLLMAVAALAIATFGILSLPGVLGGIAKSLIPPERARMMAEAMIPLVEDRTGPQCHTEEGRAALSKIADRLSPDAPPTVHVMDLGDLPVLTLPGRTVLISQRLAEAAASPDEFAGWVALGLHQSNEDLALERLFSAAGLTDSLRFLATGAFSAETLDGAVNRLLISNDIRRPLPFQQASAVLADAGIPADPLLDGIQREALSDGPLTIPPLEGGTGGPLVLGDLGWVALQGICDG